MKERMIAVIKLVSADRVRFLSCTAGILLLAFYIVPVSQERLKPSGALRIFSREGVLLRQFNSPDGAAPLWIKINEFPEYVREAAVKAEDRRFYYHPGFDPVAITRASWQNIRHLKIVSGGSTITQQTARMVYA